MALWCIGAHKLGDERRGSKLFMDGVRSLGRAGDLEIMGVAHVVRLDMGVRVKGMKLTPGSVSSGREEASMG